MPNHYCVAVLGWEAGTGGASSQLSLLSSASSFSGGEVGHLALAAFVLSLEDNNQSINDRISDILNEAIQSENYYLQRSYLPIGDSGIQSAQYLSFWGNLQSFCGGDGDMMISLRADRDAMNNRLPNIVKCSRISQQSYSEVIVRISDLINNSGNWRLTRNCSTLVRESLEFAENMDGEPLLREASFFENLSHGCIDTPDAVLSRFPDTIVIEYGHSNLVAPGLN